MIQFPDIPLPTLDRAGIPSLPPVDSAEALSIAQSWLSSFAAACSNANTQGVLNLLHPSTPCWRDLLALTWDFRTLLSHEKIAALLDARLVDTKLSDFVLNAEHTGFQQPFPDLVWVNLVFNFQTKIGKCTGIARVVPLPKQGDASGKGAIKALGDLEWKAYVVFTNLDSLIDFPEQTGILRDSNDTHTKWAAEREAAVEFSGSDGEEAKNPKVLLIGAGQAGLSIAARLKALGVPALVIEKNERVGDNWRHRYDSLSLQDPVWYDHLPYLQFPPTWPVYTPAKKLANWFEHYVDALDLNVWTSSTITSLTQDPQTHKWHVTVLRRRSLVAGQIEEQERKLVVKHVIFCTGFGGPKPSIPSYRGLDTFKGEVLHFTQYKRANGYQRKKVVIVGASTSAHDIAKDCYEQGIDVTMFQRSSTYITSAKSLREAILKAFYSEGGPPLNIADCFVASFPMFASRELNRRTTHSVAALDKEILDPLHKVGFRTNLGYDDTGVFSLVVDKLGGWYFDTGACKLVIDGKVKLKNDSQISHLTEGSIVFDNGSRLEADVVIFATGLGETRENVTAMLSASNDPATTALVSKVKPIWGVNSEGEIKGVYTYHASGIPGLWYMFGNLALARFHSSHIGLQIKAMEEGIWDGVYEG